MRSFEEVFMSGYCSNPKPGECPSGLQLGKNCKQCGSPLVESKPPEITIVRPPPRKRVSKILESNGSLVRTHFGCDNEDHKTLHQRAKAGSVATFDEPEIGHSFALINEFIYQSFAPEAFFSRDSLVEKTSTEKKSGYRPKPPCMLLTPGRRLDEGYSFVFTRRWTTTERPADTGEEGGTLFVIAVRHRDPWDRFYAYFTYDQKPLNFPGAMLSYEIDNREIPEPERQVRHVALVLNVSDVVLAAEIEARTGQSVDLGGIPLDLVVRCQFCLLEPDKEHKAPVKQGPVEGFHRDPYFPQLNLPTSQSPFIDYYFIHDCLSTAQIAGKGKAGTRYRGTLNSYRDLNKSLALTFDETHVSVSSGVDAVSSLETEAEFTVDVTNPTVHEVFNQFIVDLWRLARLDSKESSRWQQIRMKCQEERAYPHLGDVRPAEDLEWLVLPSDMRSTEPEWNVFHVPKYWKGFEEDPKGLLVELDGANMPVACALAVPGGDAFVLMPWVLRDYYYDSPDFLLSRNGGSVRLRCNARGRNLLNVKSLAVLLDDASAVRFCANLQLTPPNWAPEDKRFAAEIARVLGNRNIVPVSEAPEAIVCPPLTSGRPIIVRGKTRPKSLSLRGKESLKSDPYPEFFNGSALEHTFRVESVRHRFRFSGPANIELSFDDSTCFTPDGRVVGRKIGLEFGLDHAGINTVDTSEDLRSSGDELEQSKRTKSPFERSSSKSGVGRSKVSPSMPTLSSRFYDPYDLKEAEVSSPDGYRSVHFLILRDRLLDCLANRLRNAGIDEDMFTGVYKGYFHVAGYKANAFAATIYEDDVDRRDGNPSWSAARVDPSEIAVRPENLPQVTRRLW